MRFGFSGCSVTPPMLSWCHPHQALTVTLQPLPCQAPEEGATVLTERGALVVVDFEAVGHVDLEPLLVELQDKSQAQNPLSFPPQLCVEKQMCTTEVGLSTALLSLDMTAS